jgi:hypothetical protein
LPFRAPPTPGGEPNSIVTLLTDDHMRLLAWLDEHPTGSLAAAAQALDLVTAQTDRREDKRAVRPRVICGSVYFGFHYSSLFRSRSSVPPERRRPTFAKSIRRYDFRRKLPTDREVCNRWHPEVATVT